MLRSFVLLAAGIGVVGIGSEAFARCCHRRNDCCGQQSSCCAPAATCSAPAPSCCAPGNSSCTAPAPEGTAPIAPVEDVAPPVPGPQAGNQTYRSYSYDPAPASAVAAPAPVYYYSSPAPSQSYRANKKFMGRFNQL